MPPSRKFKTYELNKLLQKGLDPFGEEVKAIGEMPIEYFLQESEFLGRKFFVNKEVLIPRIETEELISIGKNLVPKSRAKIKFADIATGSGCIGISFALELISMKVSFDAIFSDISKAALSIASKNANDLLRDYIVSSEGDSLLLKNNSEIRFLKSDLFNSFNKDKDSSQHIIFANLPYIPTNRIESLQSSVKDFEPKIALDGGDSGLDYVQKLLQQAPPFLAKDSVIILEVDDTHDANSIEKYGLNSEFAIEILKDQNGLNRFWVCKLTR